jgi:hypothetical protein
MRKDEIKKHYIVMPYYNNTSNTTSSTSNTTNTSSTSNFYNSSNNSTEGMEINDGFNQTDTKSSFNDSLIED